MIVGNLLHPLMTMDSALRLYGHPDLLRVVECFNGPDFTTFGESIFHKAPGEGQATNWHQDGRTHWNEDGLPGRRNGLPPRPAEVSYPEDLGCHGFSFHGAFSHCTPEQCLWVLPGSHKQRGYNFPDGSRHSGMPNHHAVDSPTPQKGSIHAP